MGKHKSKMRNALLACLGTTIVFSMPNPVAAQVRDFEPNHIRRAAKARFDAPRETVYSLLAPGGQQSPTQSWDIDVLLPPLDAIEPASTFRKTHRRAPVREPPRPSVSRGSRTA